MRFFNNIQVNKHDGFVNIRYNLKNYDFQLPKEILEKDEFDILSYIFGEYIYLPKETWDFLEKRSNGALSKTRENAVKFQSIFNAQEIDFYKEKIDNINFYNFSD